MLDSTLRHNSTPASTEKLDSPRQPSTATRRAGAWSQPRQARQELDRLDRLGLDNGLDSGSTEPRQRLDSSTARQPGLNPGEGGGRGAWSKRYVVRGEIEKTEAVPGGTGVF
jgi:uncharacterized protein YjiS (DUF1127 family)